MNNMYKVEYKKRQDKVAEADLWSLCEKFDIAYSVQSNGTNTGLNQS